MFDTIIKSNMPEIIKHLQSLISIKSISEPSSNKDIPFGKGANDALLYFLNLAQSLGFKTKNVDGYCGYAEFGEGNELIGIIGHLDTVPEGENWTHSPFSGTIINDKIFGRGAIDDKGPVIASLYAMKAVKSFLEEKKLSIHKRIRLIVGLNEEKNWDCINYYKKHEEIPSIGFSPDADFPCIYAEKSVMSLYITMSYIEYIKNLDHIPKVKLLELYDGQNAINTVPKICKAVLKFNTNNILNLTSYGISAHAAHPDLGVNAISHLIVDLNTILKNYNSQIPIISFLAEYIGNEYNGNKCGIFCEDESGKLTLNIGKLTFDGNIITAGLNLRIPISIETNTIYEKIKNILNKYPFISLKEPIINPALYIPKNNNLVKTLCKIYNETTHSNIEPIAIGGATYARAFKNFVSFGPNLPGQKDMCHQTDEFISISNLELATIMYAKAIYSLATYL